MDLTSTAQALPVAGIVIAALAMVGLVTLVVVRARRGARTGTRVRGERPDEPVRTTSASERAARLDPVDAGTREAMRRLDDVMHSHDLGASEVDLSETRGPSTAVPGFEQRVHGRANADVVAHREAAEHDDPRVAGPDTARRGVTAMSVPVRSGADVRSDDRIMSEAELDAAPRTELRQQVHIVKARNEDLNKLVMAQQASLESERESHGHTKQIARQATQAARTAIEHKKIATKVARRERSERLRITDEHERSEAALANAMALLRNTARPGPVPDIDVQSGSSAGERLRRRVATGSGDRS